MTNKEVKKRLIKDMTKDNDLKPYVKDIKELNGKQFREQLPDLLSSPLKLVEELQTIISQAMEQVPALLIPLKPVEQLIDTV